MIKTHPSAIDFHIFQGKRVISENGEEGWSDVVQENAILTGEAESLRRRVKAMQGTIEQLSARNCELVAEKALANWAPKDASPDANECSLTSLVQVRHSTHKINVQYPVYGKKKNAKQKKNEHKNFGWWH